MEINILFERNFEVVAAIEFERGMTGASIFGIVVGKFRY